LKLFRMRLPRQGSRRNRSKAHVAGTRMFPPQGQISQ
jgi:hypothetical protein